VVDRHFSLRLGRAWEEIAHDTGHLGRLSGDRYGVVDSSDDQDCFDGEGQRSGGVLLPFGGADGQIGSSQGRHEQSRVVAVLGEGAGVAATNGLFARTGKKAAGREVRPVM
jgi:hypothetical protein